MAAAPEASCGVVVWIGSRRWRIIFGPTNLQRPNTLTLSPGHRHRGAPPPTRPRSAIGPRHCVARLVFSRPAPSPAPPGRLAASHRLTAAPPDAGPRPPCLGFRRSEPHALCLSSFAAAARPAAGQRPAAAQQPPIPVPRGQAGPAPPWRLAQRPEPVPAIRRGGARQHACSIRGRTLLQPPEMVFGQVVIGPPGSGKTTYCNGMSQFLSLLGRKVAVVNLDPANDALLYECAINIEDLIKLNDVMTEHSLGPNGGLVYCMDYLEKNIDWLEEKLKPLIEDHYLLFDFPGQVELFFLHSNARSVINKLIKKLNLRLTVVHLIDAHLCCDPGKYVSALLLSLSTMLHLELAHINVLSKIDLIENYGNIGFTATSDLVKLKFSTTRLKRLVQPVTVMEQDPKCQYDQGQQAPRT
ncbi:hypothetical protein U9M48_023428 [Paspalum notatum var. saurae]|uniref:GPN-loop GTPase 2 n=1 Tax=Paspalum notatum var. saurae TaxID=547442 RepID=A0AAQ3WVZ5_PASNO